jgi:hypothetical protein
MKNKFLVLGTGSDINKIDFTRIDSDLIIAGVNRIYEKVIPDIYFIYDLGTLIDYVPPEIEEIATHPDQLGQFFRSGKTNYKHNFITYYDKDYLPSYVLNGKHYDCGHGSINYLLRYLIILPVFLYLKI